MPPLPPKLRQRIVVQGRYGFSKAQRYLFTADALVCIAIDGTDGHLFLFHFVVFFRQLLPSWMKTAAMTAPWGVKHHKVVTLKRELLIG